MELDEFWAIIEGAPTPADLHDRLGALTHDGLVAFERQHEALTDDAYRWDLWGAAYVLGGGCGDDSFDYFRAYLISQGRAVYESALADPDSLAAVDLDDGEEWEDWMSPTGTVIERRTGEWGFAAEPVQGAAPTAPGGPIGERWEEEDLDALFPRMTARYG